MPIPFPTRALLLLFGLTAGCAQTASVRCWQPAEIAAGEFHSLAVVGAADDVDQGAARALEQQIQRESNFELVASPNDESRIMLAGYLEQDGTGLNGLLDYSRQADVDAVILVDVQEFEVGYPTRRMGSLSSLWGQAERTAMVRVEFKLVDTRTSEELLNREISRHAVQYSKTSGSVRDDVMLDRLLGECVDEFVADLEPHETESTIELADVEWYSLNGAAVRRGVHFARQGRWQQAEDAWQTALTRNARNDAALFNLAVASAQSGDFSAAEDYAMQALRIRHTECYAAGLEQIRTLRSASEEAEQQMRTAVVPAGFMDGPG